MKELKAVLFLKSQNSLEEVAKILSKELFGGLSFGGKEDYIRDEIPAIYIDSEIMGSEVILMGDDGVFTLNIIPSYHSEIYTKEEAANSTEVDISEYLGALLRKNESVKVMSNSEIEEYQTQFE